MTMSVLLWEIFHRWLQVAPWMLGVILKDIMVIELIFREWGMLTKMSRKERVWCNDKYQQEGDSLKESCQSYCYLSSIIQSQGCSGQMLCAFQVLGRQTPSGEKAGSTSTLRMQKASVMEISCPLLQLRKNNSEPLSNSNNVPGSSRILL